MSRNRAATAPAAGNTPTATAQPDQRREALRQRFEAVRSAFAAGFDPDPNQQRKIFEDRATQLAGEHEEQTTAAARLTLIEFLLAHERYAIEPDYVREVVVLKTLTPVPCTPAFVLGVTNLRGEIVSVIDLKCFFELPDQGLTNASRLIVLQSATMTLGVIADSVVGTRSIRVDAIQPPLPTHTGVREQYLKGVTEGRLAVLDAERILADDRIVVHEEVTGTPPAAGKPRS